MSKFTEDFIDKSLRIAKIAATHMDTNAAVHCVENYPDALQEIRRLRTAIQNCINYANNRETEWGFRAEASFKFLYDALEIGE